MHCSKGFTAKLAGACLVAFTMCLPVAIGDVVTEWNAVLMEGLRGENASPTDGTRTAAIVHAAIFDAVNSILGQYEPCRFNLAVHGEAIPEAAAIAAAYDTLTALCPSKRAIFTAKYTSTLAAFPEGAAREEGLRIGHEAASRMLEARNGDGSTTDVPYIPREAPGAWRRTWPDFRPPLGPNW